jgi:hypothetical protein
VQAPSVQEELPAARRHLYAVPLISGKEES